MRVRFTKDFEFAENGFAMTQFLADQFYDVSQSCADSAFQLGLAVPDDIPITKPKPAAPKRAVKPKPGKK